MMQAPLTHQKKLQPPAQQLHLLLQLRRHRQPHPFEAEPDCISRNYWTPKRTGRASSLRLTIPQRRVPKKVRFSKVSSNWVLWILKFYYFSGGKVPTRQSPLQAYLKAKPVAQLKDPAMNCLQLLNVLYGLNNYWWEIFDDNSQCPPVSHRSLIPQRFIARDFILSNFKIL